ncbi:hypothetical protein D3C84_243370 [compost metagenome]
MFSIPPAMTMLASPHSILCVAIEIAFIPEAHTLLTVVHCTVSDKPAKIAA